MEAITIVCDVCRKPAATTVRISVDSRNHLKDLCDAHLAELLKGARAPRRGRPRASSTGTSSAASTKSRAKPAKRSTRKAAARKAAARKTGARKTAAGKRATSSSS